MATITPYPSPSYTSVTINTLTGVWYRFGSSDWQPALADDGLFDATTEGFHFSAGLLSPGLHTLEVAAVDSAGNISDIYATAAVKIFDPIDGGLNTELYPPPGQVSIHQTSITLSGRAYHLANSPITTVQYRVNGGAWQPAAPQDGGFDSDDEPFTVTLTVSEPGLYLIEAFAIDINGNTETNIARQEVEVTAAQPQTIFLPLIANGAS
jgi:hypothetical protein